MMSHKYVSWGGFPNFPQTAHDCNWSEDIAWLLKNLKKEYQHTLAFGNGRSYGDSCLSVSNHVLHTPGLSRFISVNWEKGIVIAQAGMTLETLLKTAIPHGWFLPVTPGTQYVTLGGALANDVHGKNHHKRGTFGCHISRFRLIRSDQDPIICSPDENAEWFSATIGGLGLTGIIEWIELQLMPIASTQIETTDIRFNSIEEFFTLSTELDTQHEYSVAWMDCLAKGKSIGRGVYKVGDHCVNGKLELKEKHKQQIPFTPPFSLVNSFTLKMFNHLYYAGHKAGKKQKSIYYDNFFYPLDSILHWNRMYGRKGFQQYQCVIPESSAKDAIVQMLKIISNSNSGSFLSVLKRCGNITSPGLLSFPIPGISLALDFPENKDNDLLFFKLDSIIREAQGRLYPAKDAHMTGEDFRHFYPSWEIVETLRDPALCSHFWRRVTQS